MNDLSQAMKKTYAQLSPDPDLSDRIQQVLKKRNRPARQLLGLKPVLATGLALLMVVSSGALLRHLLVGQ